MSVLLTLVRWGMFACFGQLFGGVIVANLEVFVHCFLIDFRLF